MQMDKTTRVAPVEAILQVAFDWTANLSKLCPDLVMPPGMQIYTEKEVPVGAGNQFIVKLSLQGILSFSVVAVRFVLLLVSYHIVNQPFTLSPGLVFDYSPICFGNNTVAQHFIETRQALARTGKDYRSAYGSVEAVNHPEEGVTGLVVLHPDVFPDHLGQRNITGFIALNNLRRILIDNQHVIVLVEYPRL